MRAAEQDIRGWIDGIVVAEPAVQPKDDLRFEIRDGASPSNPAGNLAPLPSGPGAEISVEADVEAAPD